MQLTSALQNFPIPEKKNKRTVGIIGSSLGAFVILLVNIGSWVFIVWRTKDTEADDDKDYLAKVPGMAIRFSYEELKVASNNFSK